MEVQLRNPGPARGEPEDGPPGPMAHAAPSGSLYHRRQNCGKLRCASWVIEIGTPGCPRCSAALQEWQVAFFSGGRYHADERCRLHQPGYQRPGCHECGGLLLNEVDKGGLMDFSNGNTSRSPLPVGTSGTESGM